MIAVLLDATTGSVRKLEKKLKDEGWGICRIADAAVKGDASLLEGTITAAFRDEGLPPKTVLVHNLESLSRSYILRVVRVLRRSTIRPPIAILSPPLTTEEAKSVIAAALRAGADDFVVASDAATELAVRLDAIVHRWSRRRATLTDRVGDLAMPRDSRVLKCGGKCVPLTVSEYKVFQLLMRRVSRPVRREQILQQLATHRAPPKSNMAEVYILYLRRKLAAVGSRCEIVTVRGVGYMLSAAQGAESESEADSRRNSSGPG